MQCEEKLNNDYSIKNILNYLSEEELLHLSEGVKNNKFTYIELSNNKFIGVNIPNKKGTYWIEKYYSKDGVDYKLGEIL